MPIGLNPEDPSISHFLGLVAIPGNPNPVPLFAWQGKDGDVFVGTLSSSLQKQSEELERELASLGKLIESCSTLGGSPRLMKDLYQRHRVRSEALYQQRRAGKALAEYKQFDPPPMPEFIYAADFKGLRGRKIPKRSPPYTGMIIDRKDRPVAFGSAKLASEGVGKDGKPMMKGFYGEAIHPARWKISEPARVLRPKKISAFHLKR